MKKKIVCNKPFFSVCTEVTNRARTIQRTIESIANQAFRDFEYIVVNNSSDDNSDAIISSTLQKAPFKDIHVNYISTKKRLIDIESWNEPLRSAKGHFIAVCEGDDWFKPDHLEQAAKILVGREDIGIYVSDRADLSSKTYKKRYKGIRNFVPSKILLNKLINFEFSPPPSETIFRREFNGQPFFYDSTKYVYAAEGRLYYDILMCGLNGYINTLVRTVFRGTSSYRKGFFHLQDAYLSFNNWKDIYPTSRDKRNVRIRLLRLSVKRFVPQIMNRCVEKKLVRHILKEMILLKTLIPIGVLSINIIHFIWWRLCRVFLHFVRKDTHRLC